MEVHAYIGTASTLQAVGRRSPEDRVDGTQAQVCTAVLRLAAARTSVAGSDLLQGLVQRLTVRATADFVWCGHYTFLLHPTRAVFTLALGFTVDVNAAEARELWRAVIATTTTCSARARKGETPGCARATRTARCSRPHPPGLDEVVRLLDAAGDLGRRPILLIGYVIPCYNIL